MRRALAQLAVDLEEVVLGVVDHDEPADLHAHELAAELGADRAARSRHEHGAAAHIGAHCDRVELHRLAPQDVLDLDGAQLRDQVVVAVDQIVHVRQGLHRYAGLAAGGDHGCPLATTGRRHGDVHLVRRARLEDLGQLVRRPDHLDALKAVAQLVAVVVDQPDRRVAGQPVAQHLAQDQVAGVTGTDDQHLLPLRHERAAARSLDQRAGEDARAAEQDQREHEVEHEGPLRRGALARGARQQAGGDAVLLRLEDALPGAGGSVQVGSASCAFWPADASG